jgi:hypothetical protein
VICRCQIQHYLAPRKTCSNAVAKGNCSQEIENKSFCLQLSRFVLPGRRWLLCPLARFSKEGPICRVAAGQGSRKNSWMRLLLVSTIYTLPVEGSTATPAGELNGPSPVHGIQTCPETGTLYHKLVCPVALSAFAVGVYAVVTTGAKVSHNL